MQKHFINLPKKLSHKSVSKLLKIENFQKKQFKKIKNKSFDGYENKKYNFALLK